MFLIQNMMSTLILAQGEPDPDMTSLLQQLLAAVIFSAVGIAVLAISFKLMEKLTPFSIVKEIEEDQNVALAIVVGAVVLGISVIIAAAIYG